MTPTFDTIAQAEAYIAEINAVSGALVEADEAYVIDTLSSGKFKVGFYIADKLVGYC